MLAEHAAVVVEAPTGAGKTTRVPPALLAAGRAGQRRIVMLEPRRVAARAAARRMAAELDERLGARVGYHIRFDRRAGRATRILVVTEGILVRMLQTDPFLEDVGVVVFDELHERNLHSDLSLAMTRRLQREARPDLKIVVMSATLETQPIADYLGGCPVLTSHGKLYPVEVRYLERPDSRPLPAVTAAGVRRILDETPGDVLVFLPGVGEIRRTAELLAPLAEAGVRLLPLYGDLPPEQQDAVLAPAAGRRVVLATNVAETSITIDGITAVVDSGMARSLRFDPASGLDRLQLGRISRVSAEQRRGRAGRQGPGLCLRLWTAHDDRSLPPRTPPEILRVDLAAPALQLLAWGETDLARFEWLEAPDPARLGRALGLLEDLGAMHRGRLTRLGASMARLPVHPRLARLLVEGHRAGVARRAALAAALLSERDVVHHPAGRRPAAAHDAPSDLLDRLEAVEGFDRSGFGETALGPVHGGRARQVLRVSKQLAALAERRLERRTSPDSPAAPHSGGDTLPAILLTAYPDRLARRRAAGDRRGVMVGGRGVRLAEASAVRQGELFLCLELDAGRGEALVRQASRVEREWLPAAEIREAVETRFDEASERVTARRRTLYRDLVLEDAGCEADPEAVEAALVAAAKEHLGRALPLSDPEVESFLIRLGLLREQRPELGLPALDDAHLEGLLPLLAAGKRSFAELRRAPLLPLLRGTLDHSQLAALERQAPTHLEVPSGSRIRLRYTAGEPPLLAVRIQEMFGLTETPTVAGGRIPVLLHLLAPNMRPQQVTRDLASFWRNTYPQVRKELQGRYPRHAWPADPLAAAPERRPRRRR